MGQIDTEYNRILARYKQTLESMSSYIEAELAALSTGERQRYRFYIRHGILDSAETILETNAKLKVFGNFIWGPDA